jgi:hypothetical protein
LGLTEGANDRLGDRCDGDWAEGGLFSSGNGKKTAGKP